MANPEIYTDAYYRRIAALEERYWWHLGMRRIAGALLTSCSRTRRYRRVLDAGCGTGGTMAWLRAELGAELVVGVDLAPQALRLCRSRGLSTLAQASVLSLPFADGTFDLVICQDVIQHLPTDRGDQAGLVELGRVLAPSGRLLLRSNSRLGLGQPATAKDPDFQRYVLGELVQRCARAGLEVERATYANALPALYASLLRWWRLRVQFRRRRSSTADSGPLYQGLALPDPAVLPQHLNALLLAIIGAEARYLSAGGRRLPFGHTTFCVARKLD